LRDVEIGGLEGDRTAILKGVQPGERVVVEGQLRLANGARVHETKQAAPPPKTEETGAAPPQPVAKDGVVK
jgi:membrane fusion protein, multidrug efflux system